MIKIPHSLPQTLIMALMSNAVLLWVGVTFDIKILGIFYFTMLFLALGIAVASLLASIAYFLKQMDDYWATYYPILLTVTLFGYGAIKLPIQFSGLAIAAGAFILGYGISYTLNGLALRLTPTITILLFLLCGSIADSREVEVAVLSFCLSVLVGPIVKHRRRREPFSCTAPGSTSG